MLQPYIESATTLSDTEINIQHGAKKYIQNSWSVASNPKLK